ncbi:hypothetical protein PMYN1_Chma541 (chromatophore) [Paulinella micropora]|uniref:Cyanobacterial aminoacyl-tRNA synthetase CAAD domain-containing protein n=1 Tax=Paulinella micropora TaxID=1928728 RepID=A0A1L5YCD6_9EUKA|nr:hypothetical protein PCKR_592 [Paulinella micropora]AQX45136.1 hypothetical protein PFK_592 [Paulinella micropora]BBL86349.1 hypothetical protein PMYN1_Chma541 [Paulinella micropora]HRD41595.1 CAAD domain-containing protein [Prochlorococcaceae cyanobacterium AMR_MDS_5431]
MNDSATEVNNTAAKVESATIGEQDSSSNFSGRYGEVLTNLNKTLDTVDWSQMGRIGKATGILVAVIVAQILIKGVLDTINLLPVIPGLLELLGVIIVGQWSWKNLTTSEKRNAVVGKIQELRKEYLG